MKRSEVAERYKWKLEDIYPTNEAWEEKFQWVKDQIPSIVAFKGTLNTAENLLKFFQLNDKIQLEVERLYTYANMRKDEDTSLDLYQGLTRRMGSLLVEMGAATSWVSPEINLIPDEDLIEWSKRKEFKNYDYDLTETVRRKKYILSEKEERIMALTGDPFGSFSEAFDMFDNIEVPLKDVMVDGKPQKLTHGTFRVFLQSDNPKVRQEAWENMHGAFKSFINTLAAIYGGNVKKSVFSARARGYESCLSSALFREHVPSEVYTNLIKAVNGGAPAMHKYVALRNKVLGGNIHMWDMYVPLVKGADLSLEFDQAYDLVVKALAPLGKDYTDVLKTARDNRWIDVYETENKRSGAYHWGPFDVHPFVLLNYQKTTNEIFTIAHEMGHAMHSYYTKKTQPYGKGYAIFVAEVASTVNEVLLLKHLIKTTEDKDLKKYLLSYYLDMFRTTIFRQTMFAEFEATAHEMAEKSIPLTQKSLSDTYYELNKKYYGPSVIHDDMIRYEWARIPHFYRAFYVYKYATGLTSAVNIAANILKNGESAVTAYKNFLSAGGDGSPYEILKIAGVDLAKTEAYDAAFSELANTVDELEKLI